MQKSRVNIQNVSIKPKSMMEELEFTQEQEELQEDIRVMPILKKRAIQFTKHLFNRLLSPFIAAKAMLLKMLTGSISPLKVPWLKLAFLALIAFVLLKKDLRLNLQLGQPESGILKPDIETEPIVSKASVEKTSTFFHVPANYNPQAPANPDQLTDAQQYIKRYAPLAVAEMDKYGVPASIKMGQALLESRAGKSTLAVKNNNHFGVKCFSKKCGKGHCTNLTDDSHKDFFRKYESAWESWRAHSKFLAQGRYKGLLKHKNDYKSWAVGLKELGYATDKTYDKKLIRVIEKYKLHKLDNLGK